MRKRRGVDWWRVVEKFALLAGFPPMLLLGRLNARVRCACFALLIIERSQSLKPFEHPDHIPSGGQDSPLHQNPLFSKNAHYVCSLLPDLLTNPPI